jgi:hypothetical protein
MHCSVRNFARAAIFLGVLAPAVSLADDATDPMMEALSGSVRAAYWTSDRDLNEREHFTPLSVWMKATPDLGNGFALRAEGWIADERPLSGRDPITELREAFVSWHGSDVDVSLGRRIVAWGRADKINPTDVIGSRNYRRLFADDEDQRRGSLMATVAKTFGDVTATAYWLPEFRPNVYPTPRPTGVTIDRDESRFDAAQFAGRLNYSGESFDTALTYFNGIDRDPDSRILLPAPSIVVQSRHRRAQSIGADFATTVERFGLRAEAAYRLAAGRDPADVFDKSDAFAAVIGLDRDIVEDLNVNVQYLYNHVFDYVDPIAIADPFARQVAVKTALINNQLNRNQHGASLRLSYTMLQDNLMLELQTAGFFTDRSWTVRPKLTYAVTDNLKILAGLDLFFGETESFLGQLKENRTLFIELRYWF